MSAHSTKRKDLPESQDSFKKIKCSDCITEESYHSGIDQSLLGPASDDHTLCHDDKDPVSLQLIWRVVGENRQPANEIKILFSYKEVQHGNFFIRGFAIESFQALMANEMNFFHPVSGWPIPEEAILRAKKIVEILKLPEPCFEDFEKIPSAQLTGEKMKMFTLEVFQMMAGLGVFLDEDAFMEISHSGLCRLCSEFNSLFRENLPQDLLNILAGSESEKPKDTRLFRRIPVVENINILRQFILAELRRILKIARKEAFPSQNNHLAYVIVGALVTESEKIRKNFEDSFAHEFTLDRESEDEDEHVKEGDEEEEDEIQSSLCFESVQDKI